MSKTTNQIEINSEEIHDILTAVPRWMIRWGSSLILILIISVFVFTWFIKYPEVVQAKAVITSNSLPHKHLSPLSGWVDSILISEKEVVKEGQYLIVFKNATITKDILKLKKALNSLYFEKLILEFPIEEMGALFLGEMQTDYDLFEDAYFLYMQREQKGIPSVQHKKNVIKAIKKLKNAIMTWERKYVLQSYGMGQVSFYSTLQKSQMVNQGDLLLVISPLNLSEPFLELQVCARDLDKVKIGQRVIFNLDQYSYSEFEFIDGTICDISEMSGVNGFYSVKATLNGNLKSYLGKPVLLREELEGTCKIITDDVRLLERIFNRFGNVL